MRTPRTSLARLALLPALSLLVLPQCRRGAQTGQPSPTSAAPTRAPAPAPSGPAAPGACEGIPVSELIRVDQFGYRPEDGKVAVLTDPVEGWNKGQKLEPGSQYEVRAWAGGAVALTGAPKVWNNGAVEKSSGDRGAWFDFSAVKAPGSYCVVDVERRVRSYRFDVRADVYKDVLRAVFKVFYFQRANVEKKKPYACVGDKCWLAAADYVGPKQDREARSVKDRDNAKTARDLTGGWWDAGDVDKYVTFAGPPVHQLLSAYSERPRTFGDDWNIPESGNKIPDVLDELKVELDWLMKMQPSDLDGAVLLKLGAVDNGDPIPEKSTFPRFYYPDPCSSASIAAAGMFSHAALVLRDVPELKAYAEELQTRAVRAWAAYQKMPHSDACDDGTIKAGDADKSLNEQEQMSVVAATYLFALTGEASYGDAFAKSFRVTRPMVEDRWSSYDPEQGDALLFYTTLPKANADIKKQILERKQSQAKSVDIYPQLGKPELDLYRGYMRDDSFHWGHNMVRANVGNTNLDLVQLGLVKGDAAKPYLERAEDLVHYFQGVNPLGLVYLTNMSAYGAEKSATQIFHTWFRDGDPVYDEAGVSKLGPPPGYVPGGPNAQYCRDQDPSQTRCSTSRLRQQPLQKAYLDFNTGWAPGVEHDRSWEITEPGIYYQASYLKLLSKFVD